MKSPAILISAILLALCACSPTRPPEVAAASPPASTAPAAAASSSEPGWQHFAWADLLDQSRPLGFTSFLDEPSMSAGIYRLPGESDDSQSPHQRDEVYIVMEGAGTLVVNKEALPVKKGSIIYVRGGVPHHFSDFSEDLTVLVLFSKAPSAEADPEYLAFQLDQVTAPASEARNVWNRFIAVDSLRLGAYLLPDALGGDSPQTHTFDELNLVISGSGTFTVDDTPMAIQPGDLMFVGAGHAHAFTTQGEDLQVLILFEGG